MILTGKIVTLRPLQHSDLLFTARLRNDKSLIEAAMMHPFPVTADLEEDWFQNVVNSKSNKNVVFAVENNSTGKIIGFSALMNINYINRNCYHAIVLGNHVEKLPGSGTEALNLILDFAFNTLNLKKVNAEVVSTNIASIKIHEKCNFKIEGKLISQYYSSGKYYDVLIYSLINSTE